MKEADAASFLRSNPYFAEGDINSGGIKGSRCGPALMVKWPVHCPITPADSLVSRNNA